MTPEQLDEIEAQINEFGEEAGFILPLVKPMPETPPPVPMQMPPTENPVVQQEFEAKKLEVGLIDLSANPTVHMAGPDLRNALVKWLTRGNMQHESTPDPRVPTTSDDPMCRDCGFPRRSATCRKGCP